jgi:anti-sigma B factor antagonist
VSNVVPFHLSSASLTARAATVAVEGELDVYTAPELDELLRKLGDGVTHVLVDLTGVTFLDSAGVGLLTQNAKRLTARGGMMMLAIDTASVRKIFELTGLDRFFVIHEDAGRAAAQLLGAALLEAS